MSPSESARHAADIPLALYVHTPWCLRKCPYCDFNSHAPSEAPPFDAYVTRLLVDLETDLRAMSGSRPLRSIFIGGGTPSLFPGQAIRRLLTGIGDRIALAPDVEVTLEANPGTADIRHFHAYREAGVNRLSIGVQSLSAKRLEQLGRIHTPTQALEAARMARAAGFDNLNLDLMFALPEQELQEALDDLDRLLALEPEHVSYYQLTLEPNTLFHARPPRLPDADLAADMAAQGQEQLDAAGYRRYEVSAYARARRRCAHNLNYWRFGDYLGIGAGAHGKVSELSASTGGLRIHRTAKHRHPVDYLDRLPGELVSSARMLDEADTVFEFALNAFRLVDGIAPALFTSRTGLPAATLEPYLEAAVNDGLLTVDADLIQPTARGRDFLDDLVGLFVPFEESEAR